MKKKSALAGSPASEKEKRPSDWTVEEQLQALHESHALAGEQLQAWCRERGLFPHNLTSWKSAFCASGKEAAPKA
ncbi:transposase, partial [Undibacterium sp. 10I3]|nr:transposase [Undibacterium sp. 10I3]